MGALFNFKDKKTVGEAVAFYVFWAVGIIMIAMIFAALLSLMLDLNGEDAIWGYWLGVATATLTSLILLELAISKKGLARSENWYFYLIVLFLGFAFGSTAGVVPAALMTMTGGEKE